MASSASRGFLHSSLYFLKHRLGRMYDSFYNSQSSTKFVMAILFPAAIFSVRYKVDTKLGYHVFIADPSLYPDLSHRWVGKEWKNGQKFYLPDTATVSDLKHLVYSQQKPLDISQKGDASEEKGTERKLEYQDVDRLLVGCRGRMFEDTDNLAYAVRAFCRRDPNILIWKD